MISVTCACGKRLKAGDKHAGRKAKCPNCGGSITFPEEDLSALSKIRLEHEPGDGADVADAVAPLPEEAPPLPAYFPAGDADEAEPEPSPMARKRVDTRPAFKPHHPDREPSSYGLVDASAAVLVLLGIGQFILTLLVVVVPALLSPPAIQGGSDEVIGHGPAFGVAIAWGGSSFIAMVITVAFAGAVMVLVDMARVMRRVQAELRAK